MFAAAYCTSIAHGLDPCSLVYDQLQQQMRDHLYKCFITKTMDLFTVLRTKRPGPARTLKIPVYCYCRYADDGQGMVGCDGCEDWFHIRCINAAKVKSSAPSVDKVVRINDFIVNKYSLYNYFMFIHS